MNSKRWGQFIKQNLINKVLEFVLNVLYKWLLNLNFFNWIDYITCLIEFVKLELSIHKVKFWLFLWFC